MLLNFSNFNGSKTLFFGKRGSAAPDRAAPHIIRLYNVT